MSLDKAWEDVKLFHETFRSPVGESPRMLKGERAMARADWMHEEIDEFLEAGDKYEQADAMIDLIYFALGTMVEMGIPPQELFDVVQKANMSKLWPDGRPHFREDGKVVKPEGWQHPETMIKELIDSMQ